MSGRGGGKTLCAVMLALMICLREPGTVGIILSPTYRKLRDVFLKTWVDTVPGEVYKLNRSEMTITLNNGSHMIMRSRHVDNPSRGRDAHRGVDANWALDDEAAEGFDGELYANISGCLRRPGKHRFYACCTTPRLNEYYNLATGEGHEVIYSSSRDNPHLPDGWVDDLQGTMSAQQAEREIEGRWVALEGLVWSTWSNSMWPAGNVHPHKFNPDAPWYLFLDLGVGNGAYLVVQRVAADDLGQRLFPGPVWVVCAELMPQHDGSASRALQILKQHFGNPASVAVGADVNTRSNTDASTPMYFVTQIFGAVHTIPVSGWYGDKMVQHDKVQYLIMDSAGRRRLCISEGLVSIDEDPRKKRGIRELMAQDTYPENAGKAGKQFLEKDGRLEHVRDALLYGAVGIMQPPAMQKDNRVAG